MVDHLLEGIRLAGPLPCLSLHLPPHRAEHRLEEPRHLARSAQSQAVPFDFTVDRVGFRIRGSRTRLPLVSVLVLGVPLGPLRVERGGDVFRVFAIPLPDFALGLAPQERPVQDLLQPAHAHAPGKRDPGVPPVAVGGPEQERRQQLGLHPRECAVTVGFPQRRTHLAHSLDPHQCPRLARRHPESVARVGGQGLVLPAPHVIGGGHVAQQRTDLGVEPLLESHHSAKPRVELEGIGRIQITHQRLQKGG